MFFDPQCKPHNAQAQLFLDAADLIEQRGWCQHTGEEPGTGAICVLRALGLVSSFGVSGEGHTAALNFLSKLVKTRYVNIWNDMPGRTKEEVVAMLRKAAGS